MPIEELSARLEETHLREAETAVSEARMKFLFQSLIMGHIEGRIQKEVKACSKWMEGFIYHLTQQKNLSSKCSLLDL